MEGVHSGERCFVDGSSSDLILQYLILDYQDKYLVY